MFPCVSAHKHSQGDQCDSGGVACINVSGRLPSDNGRVGKSQPDSLQSGAVNGRENEWERCPAERPRDAMSSAISGGLLMKDL